MPARLVMSSSKLEVEIVAAVVTVGIRIAAASVAVKMRRFGFMSKRVAGSKTLSSRSVMVVFQMRPPEYHILFV